MSASNNTPVIKEPDNINFVIFYESIHQCTPWMNSIKMFNKKNHKVKVFQRKYISNDYNQECEEIKFEIIDSYNPRFLYLIFLEINRFFNLFKRIHLDFISNFGTAINLIYTSIGFILTIYFNRKKQSTNEIFIAGDPIALIATYIAVKNTKNLIYYWPLELWIYKDLKTFLFRIIKKLEKRAHKYAVGTLEFGELRRAILSKENEISIDTIKIIPNAPVGEPTILRNYYFNDLFGIPIEKKIILYAGGIADFNGIPQLIRCLNTMPENFALVLHSKQNIRADKLDKLKEELKSYNAYINSSPVPFDKINLIYSSCDIGLMLMVPNNGDWDTNFRYADWSPGKLFNYLQFGVPVITTDLEGYQQFIEENRIGKVVKQIDQVFTKAAEIFASEKEYKTNCIRLFNQLKFEKYHDIFYKDLMKSSKNIVQYQND